MRTHLLWRALDELGGAAPQRDWMLALGQKEWAIAGAFLRKTGKKAEELICPKASEYGCSRRLIKLQGDRFRAECTDIPLRCNHLVLNGDEIDILAIDVARLAKALIRAFDLQDAASSFGKQPIHRLGRYELHAGVGFPVFLGLPIRGHSFAFAELTEIVAAPGAKALLVPFRTAVGSDLAAYLNANNVHIFELDDVVIWHEKQALAPRFDAREIFRSIIDTLPGVPTGVVPEPSVTLPKGTLWSSISIEFQNDELVILHGPGVQRAIAPADIGMADRRTGNARLPWEWFRKFAEYGGRMHIGTGRAQKHKQFVSEMLCAFTGIHDEPIGYDDGYYVANFKLTGAGLTQGPQGRSRRNFAGPD